LDTNLCLLLGLFCSFNRFEDISHTLRLESGDIFFKRSWASCSLRYFVALLVVLGSYTVRGVDCDGDNGSGKAGVLLPSFRDRNLKIRKISV
jgi:hypothetical protein